MAIENHEQRNRKKNTPNSFNLHNESMLLLLMLAAAVMKFVFEVVGD